MPLLQLKAVSLAYGHVPLLDQADLVVEPGQRMGLIGRNGAGKSSLLRIIEGVRPADDGTVWRSPGLKLASVPQEPDFASHASVFEAVAEGLGLPGPINPAQLIRHGNQGVETVVALGRHRAPQEREQRSAAFLRRVPHEELLHAGDVRDAALFRQPVQ